MKRPKNSEREFLPLRNLIKEEKKRGMEGFDELSFKNGIYEKIEATSTEKKPSIWIHPKVVIASAIAIFLVGIGIYLFFISPGSVSIREKNSIALVLSRIYQKESHRSISKDGQNRQFTVFERSLERTLYSIQRKNIDFDRFNTDIIHLLWTTRMDHANDNLRTEDIFLDQIKRDLDEMHNKNNFIDLFLGIIKNIKEG